MTPAIVGVMTPLTRDTAKIVVVPCPHFAGARLTRTTYAACVTERTSDTRDERVQWCGHEGHPTVDAAAGCAKKLWSRLA